MDKKEYYKIFTRSAVLYNLKPMKAKLNSKFGPVLS